MSGHWIASHAFNCILGFWCYVGLIQLLLWGFRLPRGRLCYLIRLIPIAKLPVDLCRGSGLWVGWHAIDPASLEEGSRSILATAGMTTPFPILKLDMITADGYRFGFLDLFASSLPSWIIPLISALILIVALFRLVVCWTGLSSRFGGVEVKTGVWLCRDVAKPCATTGGRILLPLRALALPQSQLRAIIAHERAHVRWRDGAVELVTSCISALFWFVPGLSWWRRHLSFERECACDLAVRDDESMAATSLRNLLRSNSSLESAAPLGRFLTLKYYSCSRR